MNCGKIVAKKYCLRTKPLTSTFVLFSRYVFVPMRIDDYLQKGSCMKNCFLGVLFLLVSCAAGSFHLNDYNDWYFSHTIYDSKAKTKNRLIKKCEKWRDEYSGVDHNKIISSVKRGIRNKRNHIHSLDQYENRIIIMSQEVGGLRSDRRPIAYGFYKSKKVCLKSFRQLQNLVKKTRVN